MVPKLIPLKANPTQKRELFDKINHLNIEPPAQKSGTYTQKKGPEMKNVTDKNH